MRTTLRFPSVFFPLLLLGLVLATGCSPTKRLGEGEVFLKDNEVVVVDGASVDFPLYELEELVRPKTNRKTLIFRFNLWAYNRIDPAKQYKANLRKLSDTEHKISRLRQRRSRIDSTRWRYRHLQHRIDKLTDKRIRGWRDWLRETVGEPPVLVDQERSQQTAEYLEIFMSKRGYFDNQVTLQLDTTRNGKKATARYWVQPGQAFKVDSITYEFRDSLLAARLPELMRDTKLTPGMRFDVDAFDDERDRLAKYLTGHGYYGFVKDFIAFEADSTVGGGKVNLNMVLRGIPVQSPQNPDSIVEIPHRKFYIRNIHIHTDYELTNSEYDAEDTLSNGQVHLYFNKAPTTDPELIYCTLGFAPGDMYTKSRIDRTYRRFLELDLYNAVNMRFEQILDGPVPELDIYIFLDPADKHSISLETRGTHRDGNLGVQANLSYRHKNLFAGAESLQSGVRFGLEAQPLLTAAQGGGDVTQDVANTLRFNTFEIGPEVTLKLHRLFPLGCDRMSRSANPQTELSGAFNYQLRADYERSLWKIRYGYHWLENPQIGRQVFWDVLEVSEINITKSEAFQQVLDDLNDDFLNASYNDHLIVAGRGSILTNSQGNQRQRKYYYSRSTLELAGNALRGLSNVLGATADSTGSFRLFGIQYAQYVKFEQDFRLYRRIDELNSVALRVYPGIGIPYGNLKVLPFEKSFFAGGANGIRAWQARTLGPGSFRDTTALETFNNIGDIRLEGSVEFRFKLTSMLEGALFVDAGNVWLLREDALRPGAHFEADRFVSEIAVGAGFGARLDFDFFLVRFDLGLQLKDPRKIPGERWIWQPNTEFKEYLSTFNPDGEVRVGVPIQFNLGIGYPF